MQIDYELTHQDFTDASAVHRRRVGFGKWIWRMFTAAILVLTVIILRGLALKPSVESAKAVLPFFILIFAWIGLRWIGPNWSARRQFFKQPAAQGPRSVLLDVAGTQWRWGGGSSDIEWKNYIRALEGKRQFLLYSSPTCFNIIPKRALTPEQLSQLRELLKQNIAKRQELAKTLSVSLMPVCDLHL